MPGNIFYGKKHGVFNSNTSNSVRAAITVFNKSKSIKGFKISKFIRFKNSERDRLLKNDVLESLFPNELQIVNKNNQAFRKVDKQLNEVYKTWIEKSNYKLKDLILKNTDNNLIDIPNTCRYFTTASSKKLNRTGSITFSIKDPELYDFIYCFINSSFTYWWWRIYDGGITYSSNLLFNIPLPINLLNNDDKLFFSKIATEMFSIEKLYIVKKLNAGIKQENIKFPNEYREKINNRLLKILGFDYNSSIFDTLHINSFFTNKS